MSPYINITSVCPDYSRKNLENIYYHLLTNLLLNTTYLNPSCRKTVSHIILSVIYHTCISVTLYVTVFISYTVFIHPYLLYYLSHYTYTVILYPITVFQYKRIYHSSLITFLITYTTIFFYLSLSYLPVYSLLGVNLLLFSGFILLHLIYHPLLYSF
jgi:hypothetical protein